MTLAYRPQMMIDSRMDRAQIVPPSDVWDIGVNRSNNVETNVRTLSLVEETGYIERNQKVHRSSLSMVTPCWKEHISNALAGAVFGLFLLLGIIVAGEIEGNTNEIPVQNVPGSAMLQAGVPAQR
ncbi:cell wall hydrolase [Corynebacterium silvaticum]|uniref:Cell wall hydrolase n=1 Tax=Corynebacterium silvaticum TaxID=2320431 RepID=A0A7Y4P7S1_9CORY|nr:cell wall hydrolase [Corynebacterium silvaticum]ARU46306.1 cell wall hydrolase [Corynebacterium silvaticum]MBH5299437.1 cell wall hydrolase [Corynebacterium silvaticum]NOM64244.1 cell wall hydrolase [Corynebacterium silvaticum]NON69452.1 cell wall hydrolase [Corynebacterium silvaticum]TFA94085.1 cell wall hydrolase [Corynebacterium silvaticum]